MTAAARLLNEWDEGLTCDCCGKDATHIALYFKGKRRLIEAVPRCSYRDHTAGHVIKFNVGWLRHERGEAGVVIEADQLLVREAYDFLVFIRDLLKQRDEYQARTAS